MTDEDPSGWPKVDGANQLFWDGRRVEVRNSLTLTGFQETVTAVVTVCALLGALGGFVTGFNNATVFLCARRIDWLTCPSTQGADFPAPTAASKPPGPKPP